MDECVECGEEITEDESYYYSDGEIEGEGPLCESCYEGRCQNQFY